MLRRRWLLLVLGTLALGAVGLTAAALLIERTPFRFLESQRPCALTKEEWASIDRWAMTKLAPDTARLYTFQADAGPLRQRAAEELTADGFRIETDSLHNGSLIVDARRGPESVMVFSGVRYLPGQSHPDNRSRLITGWAVVIVNTPRPSFLERLKRLLGL